MAEALAFASLVKSGTHVRFSGQDSRRGTFNQRHSVLIDIENENEYVPLENIAPGQARCEIYNSTLSEVAVLGFEYGFAAPSLRPRRLGSPVRRFRQHRPAHHRSVHRLHRSKWHKYNGLVMLLPHGYEGQGPEHRSYAYLDRFLALCARKTTSRWVQSYQPPA